jgi:hypothetical protein
MSTFIKNTNGNVIYEDPNGREHNLGKTAYVSEYETDTLFIVSALLPDNPFVVDYNDVTAPVVATRQALFDELTQIFFFDIGISVGNTFTPAIDFDTAQKRFSLYSQNGDVTISVNSDNVDYAEYSGLIFTDGNDFNFPSTWKEIRNEYSNDAGIYRFIIIKDKDHNDNDIYEFEFYSVDLYNPALTDQHAGLCLDPSGMAVDNINGKLYILESGSTALRKIDIATMTEDSNIAMPGNGYYLTIDEANEKLFASIQGSTSIVEISLSTFSITTSRAVSGGINPLAIYLDPDSGKFYISEKDSPYVIQEYTNHTLANLEQTLTNYGHVATQMQVSEGFLFVTSVQSDDIAKINLSTGVSTDIIAANVNDPVGLLIDETYNKIVSMDVTNNLINIFNKDTYVLDFQIGVDATTVIRNIANYPTGRKYFIANWDLDEIIEIDY